MTILGLGTLGPSGTSSEQAVKYYVEKFLPWCQTPEILLFESFDRVLKALMEAEILMAVVPHAYAEINKFYINYELNLLQMFVYDTPPYGLFKHPQQELSFTQGKLVSHPAPLVLMDYFLNKKSQLKNYQVELVQSTSLAAQMVKNKVADVALTNEHAANLCDLELLIMYGAIRMGWSVFIRNKNEPLFSNS